MPIDPGTASIISAGINVGGKLLGRSKQKISPEQHALQQFAVEDARKWHAAGGSLAAHKSGIRWKVADAKRAGLHPLFALGHQVTAGPSAFISGQAQTGSGGRDVLSGIAGDVADGVANYANAQTARKLERRAEEGHQAGLAETLSRIRKNNAEAAAAASVAARTAQESNYFKPTPLADQLEPRKVKVTGKDLDKPSRAGAGTVLGELWHTKPSSSAEFFEKEYGDVGSVPFQLLKLWEDLQYNMDIARTGRGVPKHFPKARGMSRRPMRIRITKDASHYRR